MNFKKVEGHPFRFVCTECHQVFDHGFSTTAYADLDGRPFRDYYCNKCAYTIYRRDLNQSPSEAADTQA